jgi:MoxR-like ATPase
MMADDEREEQMLVAAEQVADFAYKQGVGEAVAVDRLIRKYRRLRDQLEITAEMIERGAEGLAAERISNGWHDDAEACLRAALGGDS